MKWEPADCEYGDIVRVKLGSVYHYGIFVSGERVIAFGLPPVEEYKDDPERFKVVATDADVFSCGKIIEKALFDRKELKAKRSPDETVSTAESRLGEGGYDILHNNCEHFANECAFGVSVSYQEREIRDRWLSRPICDVYIMKIPEEADFNGIYPAQREAEIAECRAASLRAAKLADWRLLAFAAKRSLGIDVTKEQFKKSRHGRWSSSSFDFSLSHTDAEVAVAVSNAGVGVDIEPLASFSERRGGSVEKLYDRFLTDNEKKRYSPSPLDFLICWTRKEAEYKRAARGPFKPLSIDAALSDAGTYLIEKTGTVLSVAAKNVSALRVFSVEGESAAVIKPERIG